MRGDYTKGIASYNRSSKAHEKKWLRKGLWQLNWITLALWKDLGDNKGGSEVLEEALVIHKELNYEIGQARLSI